MGLQFPDSSKIDDFADDTLFYMPLYLLDSIKKGTLFNQETIDARTFTNWLNHFFYLGLQNLPFPSEAKKTRIQLILKEKIEKLYSSRIDFKKEIESIDFHDEKSIKNLLKETKKKTVQSLEALETFLKEDQFPPYLWMEFDRYCNIHMELTSFFSKILLNAHKFAPTKPGQAKEKSKKLQAVSRVYFDLMEHYFQTIQSYLCFTIFMEVWSCEKAEDLFTPKCTWTFEKIDRASFDQIFIRLHNSINQLTQTYFKIKPQKANIDISNPTDWAFKQLIVMS